MVIAIALVPAADGAVGQARLGLNNDLGRVEVGLDAEPIAARAGPGGLLNENSRGSSSAMLQPQTGQA